MTKVTVSIIKCDVGGWPGHSTTHPKLEETAEGILNKAKSGGLIKDFHVTHVGDDLDLIMSHTHGADNEDVHALAFDAFEQATEVAEELGLYGAGQDLLSDAFSGNVRGMGPGVAELEFTKRVSEPILAFLMDKTEPGAFNLPIYRMFADPFSTAGLVIDPNLHKGFVFEIWDIKEHNRVFLQTPEDSYKVLALIGAKERFVIKRVFPKPEHKLPSNEPVVAVSTEKLVDVAGEYVGKDDPVALVRAQSGLPAVGEVLEPFAFPHLVSGWMRGSHNGPIMPVGTHDANCTRFDGPPRVVGLGFNLTKQLGLAGPVDHFDDPAYDNARQKARDITDYMRMHGPFEPHRLPLGEMEYTTLPGILDELEDGWQNVDEDYEMAENVVVGEVE
ncbi:MAG: fructose-1,6-bisphosphate aldolase/phosphatase [Candidatus Thermoplasmatota archaeon]|nr:fructose-1,6-bisphosphate aldolase/phosphatase [Candidatus Thermoplasmatota archaeon]